MIFTKPLRTFLALTLVLLLSNIPHVLLAETVRKSLGPMIPTEVVVNELAKAQSRERDLADVEGFLSLEQVQKELEARGLSKDEARLRVAALSETELRGLAKQMDQARAGGDILIAILLVVLIIFLIKRI